MPDTTCNAASRDSADIPGILSAMKAGGPRQRNATKALLLQKGPEKVLPHLEAALRDDNDADRRNSAIEVFVGFGADSLPALSRLAMDQDWEIRNFACVMLGDIADPASVPVLLTALKDEEPNVSHAAAEALGKIGDPSAAMPLMEALDLNDFWSAYPIIAALGELGDKRAAPIFLGCLENEFLAPAAVQALGNIDSLEGLDAMLSIFRREVAPLKDDAFRAVMKIYKKISGDRGRAEESLSIKEKLRRELGGRMFSAYLTGLLEGIDYGLKEDALIAAGVLKDCAASGKAFELLEDEGLAPAALEAVREIGITALPEAVKHLKNPSGRVRQALVDYLGGLGPGPGVRELIGMLHDDMTMIRAEAAIALGRIGASEAVGGLADALEDESPEVQEAAVAALSGLSPQLVFRNLLPYIRSGGDPQCVRLAAETLGRVKAEEALKPLGSLLEDPREAIREVAVKAIGRIGGENAAPFLMVALEDPSRKVAQQAVTSMGKVSEPQVLQRLIKFVREKDEAFCYYAICALKEQGSPLAIFSLMEILKGSSMELMVAALEALGGLGRKEVCPAVLDVAGTDDVELLRVSVQTLGRLGCEKAAPRLTELVSHPHWSIRASAIEALGKIGGEDAYGAIRAGLNDEDAVVRKTAAAALAMI